MPKFLIFPLFVVFAVILYSCGGADFNNTSYPVSFPDCRCDSAAGEESGVYYSFTGKNSVYQNGGYAFFLSARLINKTPSRVRYVRNKALIESKNFNYFYGQEETFLINPRDTAQFLLSAACKLKPAEGTIEYAAPDTEAVSITLFLYTEPKGKVITVKTLAGMKLR